MTILEDEAAIWIDDVAALEGDGQMAFSVRLSVASTQTVTVDWTTADGTAIAGQDYEATTGTLTFSALETAQTIRVPIIDDDLDEVAEAFTVALSNASNAIIKDGEAIGEIADNDLPVVSATADAAEVEEGETVAFTLTRIGDLTVPLTVMVDVTERGAFLADEAPTKATFAVDAATTTLLVATDDDQRDEADGAVTATITSGAIHRVGESNSATVLVADNDLRGVIATPTALTVDEGNSASYTVALTSEPAADVTVAIQLPENADIAVNATKLTFTAEDWNQAQTVTVTAAQDDDSVADDPVTITHAVSGGDYEGATAAEVEVTIIEDDTAGVTISTHALEVPEGDREITFAVTLGAVSGLAVTVDWTTADGTATADADYAAAEGRLTFAPGQAEATVAVVVFNDALDEGTETFTIELSNPSNATIADDTATGTITDDDPSVEKAWLARFGRTTASQVMDAVSNRLMGRYRGNAHLMVGGQRVTLAARSGQGRANAVGPSVPAKNASLSQHPFYHLKRSSFADIISRSSFLLSAATDEERDVRWTAWGRGATTRFRSEEVDLSLAGSPVTALLGVDRQQGRTLAGLAVAHSLGTGEFDVHTAEERFRKGDLRSYLTSVHPYLRIAMTERLSAWGLLGYGRGQMERMADRPDADIAMQMGGLGARGTLLSPTESSAYDVALKSDAFLVRMDADAADRPDLETMMSRLRLQLEGGRPVALESGRMSPSLEVGVRHDGGDAETGLGLEVGGNLGYTHSQRGVALQATARRRLMHQASGYEEWGLGGSLNIDRGALGRGPSLRMHSSWGSAASGMDRLWLQRRAADLARSAQAAEARLFDAELGYGLDALGGLLTPYARVASGRDTHTYGLGGRLRVEQSLRVDLVAERRERTTARAGHGLELRSTLYW